MLSISFIFFHFLIDLKRSTDMVFKLPRIEFQKIEMNMTKKRKETK